jgi:hypothetical protein
VRSEKLGGKGLHAVTIFETHVRQVAGKHALIHQNGANRVGIRRGQVPIDYVRRGSNGRVLAGSKMFGVKVIHDASAPFLPHCGGGK